MRMCELCKDAIFILLEDKLEDHAEFLTLFKTTNQRSKELKSEIKKRHPYETPELVELRHERRLGTLFGVDGTYD